MENSEIEKNTMKMSSVAVDSDFMYFLEKNFPSSAMILSKENANEESVYYVMQRFQEKYNIWKQIPEWIKNYYGGILPPEVFTVHEPYQQFVMTFEHVMMQSSKPDASLVNNIAYSDEHAKTLILPTDNPRYQDAHANNIISSCEKRGYSKATTAKLLNIYVADSELFDSGEISTPEGKFMHKVYNIERIQAIEEAMSPEQEVLHALKELRRIEAKTRKEEDEEAKKQLEQEKQELLAYIAKKTTKINDIEFLELLADELDKIKDNKEEITGSIKKIKEAITPKDNKDLEKSSGEDVVETKEGEAQEVLLDGQAVDDSPYTKEDVNLEFVWEKEKYKDPSQEEGLDAKKLVVRASVEDEENSVVPVTKAEQSLKVVNEAVDLSGIEKTEEVKQEEIAKPAHQCSKEERRSVAMSRIFGSLGGMVEGSDLAVTTKELAKGFNGLKSEDDNFEMMVRKINEIAPEDGYFSRKIRDKKFDRRERIFAKKIINGEEFDIAEMFEMKHKDSNRVKINKALGRIGKDVQDMDDEVPSAGKEVNNVIKPDGKGGEFSL